ncbi:hypothetical protein J6590_042937 [Homalodisca vitripennis]|nr:hypothetical protein J6590_042937 [Homalodisca vitripennis]
MPDRHSNVFCPFDNFPVHIFPGQSSEPRFTRNRSASSFHPLSSRKRKQQQNTWRQYSHDKHDERWSNNPRLAETARTIPIAGYHSVPRRGGYTSCHAKSHSPTSLLWKHN